MDSLRSYGRESWPLSKPPWLAQAKSMAKKALRTDIVNGSILSFSIAIFHAPLVGKCMLDAGRVAGNEL